MKIRPTTSKSAFLLQTAVLIWAAARVPSAYAAPVLWNGPTTNFTQTAVAPPSADVIIPGAVSLARNGRQWLYNTNVDLFGPSPGTPTDTEWAMANGPINSVNDAIGLSYKSFDLYRNTDLSGVLLGSPPSPGSVKMVMHLTHEDIYIPVSFTAWPHGGGLFGYNRATAPSVTPPPTPSVTITNPAGSAVFAAPANVKIVANATVSTGSVTNVAFFGNGSALGSKQTAPFTITTGSLGAGPYSLTAVATAAGISATSAVVSISVVTPVTTTLAAPTAANNQFTFSYGANAGLRYVVESSSNLFDWTPVITNVASGSLVPFTNSILPGDSYFRVGRLPNP